MPEAAADSTATFYLDRIALLFQEIFTGVVRIRAGRERISNLDMFRSQVLALLAAAREQARRKGYSEEQTRYAVFAVVAFVDESVLSSPNPLLAQWRGRPLQEELFKGHVAGETFFQYVRELLTGDNSQRTADLLEVYQLCLLLGYRGRYGSGAESNLRAIQDRIREKITRIRGEAGPLSRAGLPSAEPFARERERWSRVMVWSAVTVAALALVLLIVYRNVLSSALAALSLWILPGGFAE